MNVCKKDLRNTENVFGALQEMKEEEGSF